MNTELTCLAASGVAGAEIFLGARLVHAGTYFLGVTGIRTLAYVAGVVGTVLISTQLI